MLLLSSGGWMLPGVALPRRGGRLAGIYPRFPWEDSYPKDLEVILAQVAGLTLPSLDHSSIPGQGQRGALGIP